MIKNNVLTKKKMLYRLERDYKYFEKKYLSSINDRIAYGNARIMEYIEELERIIKGVYK